MSIFENIEKKRAGPLRRGCARVVRALVRCIVPCYGASRRRRRDDSVEKLCDEQVSSGEVTSQSLRDDSALTYLTGDGSANGEAIRTVKATAIASGCVIGCSGRAVVKPQRTDVVIIENVARTRTISWSVPASEPRSCLADSLAPVETTRGRYAGATQVIQTADRVFQITRAVAPWPLSNLTTVHLQRQPITRADVARVGGEIDGGPITVTVGHGGALKSGHLDGRFADAGVAGAAWTQMLLVLRLPTKRPVPPANARPAYHTAIAGRCDTATVTRPGRMTGASCFVIDVPVLTDARNQPVANVRVLLSDGAELGRVSRMRKATRDEFVCTVLSRYRGFVGRVDAVEYRQLVGPDSSEIDLVVTGPAIFCHATPRPSMVRAPGKSKPVRRDVLRE